VYRRNGPQRWFQWTRTSASFEFIMPAFFDPGFGYVTNDIKGTHAVLEVRAHEVPFLIENGQMLAAWHIGRCLRVRTKYMEQDRFFIPAAGPFTEQAFQKAVKRPVASPIFSHGKRLCAAGSKVALRL